MYRHKNFVLDMNESKGKLYVDGWLRFMGDHYVAITMLLRFSENHPDVREKFKTQLEMREKPRFAESERGAKKDTTPMQK